MATQQDIAAHYDLDNSFFALFLDKLYRVYTCGVWENTESLEQAQLNKFKRMCNFANIKPNHYVLDVGCGWGGLMGYITSNYQNTKTYGLTLSKEQFDYVKSIKNPNIDVDLRSWENFIADKNKFDSIICIGGLEHFANMQDSANNRQRDVYKNFFEWCLSVSKDEAYVGLHSIIITRAPKNMIELNDSRFLLEKVFPGSALPSISDIQAAIVDKYEISEAKRIGMDYAKTLTAWQNNLEREKTTVLARYGEEVYDHHIHYLEAARRCFESGYTDLYQISLKRAQPIRVFMR